MTRLTERMLAMEKILVAEVPNTEKIISASQQLSGIELNKLSESIKRKINHEFLFLNSILAQYPIKTFEDYNLIIPRHLEQMVAALKRICQQLKKFAHTNYALRQGL